jgi:chloramphenicol 3-O phosphotransferase
MCSIAIMGDDNDMAARIIVLNGTSSAGKSTLAAALRPVLPKSFCYYASDQLADAGFRPLDTDARSKGREAFFSGFHLSIAAFASAGLDLLVEHVVEQQAWADQLGRLLSPFDVFWVGVRVPLDVLERRELDRGDRALGEAEEHLATHNYCIYDLEVENVGPPGIIAQQVVRAWEVRRA